MRAWDRSKAIAAFEAFGLTGSNTALAVYWLSLWRDDAPPVRGDFNPARVKDLLPAIALTEMRSNGDAVCRLAGRHIDLAMGAPALGMNMLALVGEPERRVRSGRLKAIVDGAIGLSRTHYTTSDHSRQVAETLQLPFFGTMEDGSRQYLSHTNWRPRRGDVLTPRWDAQPDDYAAVGLG
jgi:hypothetical protein